MAGDRKLRERTLSAMHDHSVGSDRVSELSRWLPIQCCLVSAVAERSRPLDLPVTMTNRGGVGICNFLLG
jgi:hypothetical protein